MRIAVFGLGYVGAVTASCFAAEGHCVIGVDTDAYKVQCIMEGRSPIVERDLEQYIRRAREAGRLVATTCADEAVAQSDIALICVGTPSRRNGSLNLEFVERVCRQIGAALAGREQPYIVVVRSTVLPGTCEGLVIPTLEKASGRRHGEGVPCVHEPGVSARRHRHPRFPPSSAHRDRLAEQAKLPTV
jgi:GDP-mannose 6-dehydrogenase